MPKIDSETLGPLLHGTAHAWRLKLDERLKPLGLSQAKWRTLFLLSLAHAPITQSEIASRLGVDNRASISGYERGEREPPLPVLLAYARLAGVSVESLIDDKMKLR